MMSKGARFAGVASALILAGPAVGAGGPAAAPVDRETTIASTDVVCTGFGRAAREAPKWRAYSVRFEFSNARDEYLAGATVKVWDRTGRPVFSAVCEAPWLLARLAPGDYRVEASPLELQGAARSARFTAPRAGQVRVVLQFRDLP
jgi:FAD/FMN-containing dehydrogenase